MKKFIQVLLVAGIMLIGILGITNPGHKLYKMLMMWLLDYLRLE